MSSCVHIVHIIQWSVLLLFKQNLDLAIMETSSEVSEIKMTVEIHRDCWNIQNTPYHNVNWPSGEGLKARFLDLIILSPRMLETSNSFGSFLV